MSAAPKSPFWKLERFVSRIHGHEDKALVELIHHHAALYIAQNTAPNDGEIGYLVEKEIPALCRLLAYPVTSMEGVRLRGRYLAALRERNEWERDSGTMEALLAGMVAAGIVAGDTP